MNTGTILLQGDPVELLRSQLIRVAKTHSDTDLKTWLKSQGYGGAECFDANSYQELLKAERFVLDVFIPRLTG